jgi:hypothetical protein
MEEYVRSKRGVREEYAGNTRDIIGLSEEPEVNMRVYVWNVLKNLREEDERNARVI